MNEPGVPVSLPEGTGEQRFTAFDYLLNAFELASQHKSPASQGYGEKRRALYAYVRALEAKSAAPLPRSEGREAASDEMILRKLVWLLHSCSHHYGLAALYGDDGEMQCSVCRFDFRRAPANEIDLHLIALGRKRLDSSPTTPSESSPAAPPLPRSDWTGEPSEITIEELLVLLRPPLPSESSHG